MKRQVFTAALWEGGRIDLRQPSRSCSTFKTEGEHVSAVRKKITVMMPHDDVRPEFRARSKEGAHRRARGDGVTSLMESDIVLPVEFSSISCERPRLRSRRQVTV